MATQLDPNVKDDLKTQFVTREGTYRLLTLSEYSRPNRVGYTSNQQPQVRVSVVTLPNATNATNASNGNGSGSGDGITNTGQQQQQQQQQRTYATSNTNNCTTNGPLTNGSNANATTNAITSATNNTNSNSSGSSNTNNNNNNNSSSSSSNTNPNALINGQQHQQPSAYVGDSGARLGAGMSMHSMLNGTAGATIGGGGIGSGGMGVGIGGEQQNGLASQIYGGDRICFNFGRELYVYAFRGVKKGTEMSKPIDKKFYKSTNPSCHDFNAASATPTGAPLLVGFTTGQIQLVSPQPGPREMRKLYNEERLIDKTKVTCLKWLPNSPNLFLASHASGHLYLYNEDLPCTAAAPNYQPFKMGDGYTILTCKSKSTRNPLYKWVFSTENCCINEFCFSPCGSNLAIVSQDGFLRVFHYDTMELLGIARSYFGGFLCVCWSPDGKYIVVGGEDDLVTVWSLHERRVVARGQGHRSWVSVVAFDPYTTSYANWDGGDFSDDENQMNEYGGAAREARFSTDSTANGGFDFTLPPAANQQMLQHARTQRPHSASFRSDASSAAALPPDKLAISYRLGSVGQDTQICLWDITEDVLRHPLSLRQRVNSVNLNDTSYMNGGIDADGVKLIRPVAIGNATGSFPPPQHASSPIKDVAIAENSNSNSNSSSSKFSTANCTISSQSSNANTPPDEPATVATTNANANSNNATSSINSNTTTTANTIIAGKGQKSTSVGNSIKFPNCISATKSDSIDGSSHGKSNSSTFSSSLGGNSSKGSNKSPDSGVSTFNSLTQRLSNFSFLSSSDKKAAAAAAALNGTLDGGGGGGGGGSSSNTSTTTTSHRNHRKAMGLLKSYNNNHNSNGNNSSTTSNQQQLQQQHSNNAIYGNATALELSNNSTLGTSATAHSFGSLKLGKSSTSSQHSSLATSQHGAVVSSYDPMKLIGTAACPRFDECPLLEPLVCKKIAHERLSALIFREDCFLTACQDGFIYTWARPGYATNVPQHLSPSQAAPPGGTVI